MTESEASLAFSALGHAGARTVLRALNACAPGGLAPQELIADLGLSSETVFSSLDRLAKARFIVFDEPLWRADPAGLISLQSYLLDLKVAHEITSEAPTAAE